MRIEELNLLRNEDLLNLARNPVAGNRSDAIRLLIERGSHLASHPDIATESASLVYAEPIILKKSDPASEVSARKLPGLIDVVAKAVEDNRKLSSYHSTLAEKHGQHVEKVNARHKEIIKDFRGQIDNLRAERKSAEEKLTVALEAIQQEWAKEKNELDSRIARLERSLWRKFVDWIKGR